MLVDEVRGAVVVRVVAGKLAPVHADVEILAHLKMQMDGIHAVVAAHRPDELAFFDDLPDPANALMQVSVLAVHHGDLARLITIGVPDNDAVSPACSDVFGDDHDTARRGINGSTQIAVATTAPVPVFAHVAIGVVAAELVIVVAVGLSDREIKAICKLTTNGVDCLHSSPDEEDQQPNKGLQAVSRPDD